MKIKQRLLLLIYFGVPLIIFCQTGHGFSYDNYNGIYGATINPAHNAQSKHRWHINGVSLNQIGTADYGTINYLKYEINPNGYNGLDFTKNTFASSNINRMNTELDILLPSVLYNIGDNHSIGLLLRSRAFSDYNGFNGAFFKDLNTGFDTIEDQNSKQFNSNFDNTSHYWKELGLNYAVVLINSNFHFLKFGGTAKYLLGNKAVEFRGTLSGNYSSGENGSIDFTSIGITYLNIVNENNSNQEGLFYKNATDFNTNGRGFGGDIGFVYEWRPRETNRVDVRSNVGAINIYKLKISAAVLDLGGVTYTKYEKNDNTKTIRQTIITTPQNTSTTITKNALLEGNLINALQENTRSEDVGIQQGEVTFALPRSLNLGLDYIIFNDKNYYINLNYVKTLTKPGDEFTNSRLDLITLTPRYETQKFSVYLPITYEQSTTIYAGLGLRFGPVTVGSAALSSLIMEGEMKHLYFGLNLPLFQDVFR